MNDEQKAQLEKAAQQADTVTDWTLGKVTASRWSWAIILVVLTLAAGFGYWLKA